MYSKRKWVKTWKKYIELTISFVCKIQQGRWLRFQTQVHIPLQRQSRQQIHCNFHFFLRNFCLCRWYILSLKLSARNYNDNQWVQASSIWYSFLLKPTVISTAAFEIQTQLREKDAPNMNFEAKGSTYKWRWRKHWPPVQWTTLKQTKPLSLLFSRRNLGDYKTFKVLPLKIARSRVTSPNIGHEVRRKIDNIYFFMLRYRDCPW